MAKKKSALRRMKKVGVGAAGNGFDLSSALERAVRCQQAGQLDQAERLFREIAAQQPEDPQSLYNLGLSMQIQGKAEEAAETYQAALALKPAFPECHFNLGHLWRSRGMPEKALAAFERVQALRPDDGQCHYEIGNVLKDQDRLEEAVESYRRALAIRPGDWKAHNNLGNALQQLGRLDEAAASYRRALELKPDYAEAHNNLGNALKTLDRLDEAIASYRRALELKPDYADAHCNLGNAFQMQERYAEAVECYRRSEALQHGTPECVLPFSSALSDIGEFPEAEALLDSAVRRRPDDRLLRLRRDTFCPALFASEEELDARRARIEEALDGHGPIEIPSDLSRLTFYNAIPDFFLAYHGRDDLPIRSKFADLFAPAFEGRRPPVRGGKPRVGFVVTRKHEGIFVKIMGGLLRRLPKGDFELCIVCDRTAVAGLRASLGEGVAFRGVGKGLAPAVEALRAERFDVLFFYEVGTDPTNYFLPFFRLAPVQCTSWGYPVTSGIPAMDYFLSSALMEPEGAQRHYREELWRFESLPIFYERPSLPEMRKGRADFGFSEAAHLYACPQSLFKLHPAFDACLAEILRRDPRGTLLLVRSPQPGWDESLRRRLRTAMPGAKERIRFLPRMGREDFVNLLALSDVVLDPIHYGGGNTVYESLAMGVPLVTWPGEFMRGRITHACYRRMGVTDCVASSPGEYVETAVRLGTDPAQRAAVRERILAAGGVLFEDEGAVREMASFFAQAVEKARTR